MKVLESLGFSLTNCILLLWMLQSPCWADEITASHVHNSASIAPKAFNNTSGRLGINQSAGDRNLQTNSHAMGDHVVIRSDQINPYLDLSLSDPEYNVTIIEEFAFEGAQGLISINQVSGHANVQANLGAIAMQSISGLGVEDSALDNVTSPTNSTPLFGNNDVTHIANDSFSNVQGIVQINQVSGDGNSAINQFSLQLPSGN